MLGFCLGIFIYPVPTTSLFVSYGFNEAMIMFSPIMLIHILGVVFFSQKNGEVAANKLPERKSVKESVSSMTEDPKVNAAVISMIASTWCIVHPESQFIISSISHSS